MSVTPLKIMTWNIRFASNTAPNEWNVRRGPMNTLIEAENPDILGTQEGIRTPITQLEHIATDLGSTYSWLGVGRDAGGTAGEHMAIFYRNTRLSVVTSGNFWMSDTPDTPGSNWAAPNNNAFIRMCTWAQFRDRRTGHRFYVYNTHLDNSNNAARLLSADLIHTRIAAHNPYRPVIVMGDFNQPAERDNAVYQRLLGNGKLHDTWFSSGTRGTEYKSHMDFQTPVPVDPAQNLDRIDWIFATKEFISNTSYQNISAPGGQYPSDHIPVISW